MSVVGFAMYGSKPADVGFPEARYRLSLPKTLVDNRYELTRDVSDSEGQKLEEQAAGGWDVKLAGAADPEWSRNDMMKGGGDGEGAEVVVPPKDFHPAGSGGITITCEVSTRTDSPSDVDLDKPAATTLQIRSEMRKPV
ncbi:hypothetical protein [Streptomyces sp. NPDC003015]